MLDRVDVIASDHNAPVAGNEGPGLDAADQFLAATLTVASEREWALGEVLGKLRDVPAAVFRTGEVLHDGLVVVDPSAEELIAAGPGQESRRIPYVGTRLRGRVVAVGDGDHLRFV